MAVSVAAFWPGISSFLILLALGLTGLGYYTRLRRPRSAWFWATGIAVCILLAYAITVLAVVPFLLRSTEGTDTARQGAALGRASTEQAGQAREIPLSFVPEPVEELPPGEPGKEWKEQRSVALTGMAGKGQVSVRLYTDAKVSDP